MGTSSAWYTEGHAPRAQSVEKAVDSLRAWSDVLGVMLFGSVARGDDNPHSDVDLIVLVEEGADRKRIREAIKGATSGTSLEGKITPIFFTPDSLNAELVNRPSFSRHLADEGMALYWAPGTDWLPRQLSSLKQPTPRDLQRELEQRMQALSKFEHLDRLNNEFAPTMSQLYVLARSVVILKLMQRGIRKYDGLGIFDTYSTIQPSLERDLERLKRLRSYYEYVHDKGKNSQDIEDIPPRDLQAAISSLKRVAAS